MNIYRALLRRYRPEAFEIARRALLAGSASIFAAAAARAAAGEKAVVSRQEKQPQMNIDKKNEFIRVHLW